MYKYPRINKGKWDMKRKRFNGKIITSLLIMVVLAIALLCMDFSGDSVIEAGALKENYDYGEFTMLKEMKLSSGKTAYYYESGDEYFSYAHDSEGYVLVKDEERGTLEYARNEQGKPVQSGVSYGATSIELSKIAKMQGSDIDLTNPEVQNEAKGLEGMTVINNEPVLAKGTEYRSITNLTIFISFKGENFTPDQALTNMFNGQNNSLRSYYQSISNNRVNINSQIPVDEFSNVFVYQDEERRDYYNVNNNSRWSREASLVSNAINQAKARFLFTEGTNLDVNGDGYIDSVSIIIHGKSSSTWGSLLWPHSVSLDAIDGDNNYTVVNGVKVGNFSLNFSENITLGVLCHETAHVLGAPDLYHYGTTTQNQDIITVGKWDLMEIDLDTPQYLLAHMRQNYIGGIFDSQIENITENGVYSLKPVTLSTEDDVIAYKIPTSRDEYFMVEYRKQTASGYDSMLPGSGLIVYRIKEPADYENSRGNMDAVYLGTGSRADEVYVFRPSIKMTGTEIFDSDRYAHSLYDIDYAYLSPNNQYFKKVGKEYSSRLYDFETIYYSDGSNSDIVIEALSIGEESIEFSVKLGEDIVEDDYFNGKISLESVDIANASDYAGVVAKLKFGTFNPKYLSALDVSLMDANGNEIVKNSMNLGKFLAEYNNGTREITTNFIYASKGNIHTPGVFDFGIFTSDNEPKTAVVTIKDADGDSKVLLEVPVTDSGNHGWDTILETKTELKASIMASARMTVGVRRDGTVDASGWETVDQWAVEGIDGVVSVALGYTHTLLLTQGLNVISVGKDSYSETNVSSWMNVKAVAAGTYSSYGLKTNGEVVATGLNDKGQLNVSSWKDLDVVALSAMGKRVAGLTGDGKVVVAGSFTDVEKNAISALSGIKQVAVGLNYIAFINEDDSVSAIGSLPGADFSEFKNVEKISAGTHHLIALRKDGKVVATGDNSYGQLGVSGLYDVIDVAAGESHSAFLREDGVVEFRGEGSSKYGTNEGIGNLLYDNYLEVNEINGVTGVVNGKIRIIKGETRDVLAQFYPTNATYVRMIFTSSDTSVATVTTLDKKSASIQALEEGTSILTIKAHGTNVIYTATIEVYEDKKLEGIAFTESTRSIIAGQSAYLSVIFKPTDGDFGSLTPTFTSSAPDIISVNESGLITAVGEEGSATITAEAGGFSATIVVTIVKAEVTTMEVVDRALTEEEQEKGIDLRKYRYGEDLDTSRYILKVKIGESETESVAITPGMVSGYNKSDATSLSQTLKVTYMGEVAEFNVYVRDYVTHLEKVEEPNKRYLYNYDIDAESGGFLVYMASGKVEGPNKFSKENFVGYHKDRVGLQKVNYVYEDREWKTQFIFEEEFMVVDYVKSISFQPIKTNYAYGANVDLYEFVDVNMMSGATRQVELLECLVKDEHTPISDASNPLYALYSLRLGPHLIHVTYVDQETKAEMTTTTTLNVEIDGSFKTIGRDQKDDCFYYEVGSDPYLGVSLLQRDGKEIEIAKKTQENQGIYFDCFTRTIDGIVAFDNTIEGEQDALIKVFVDRQSIVGTEMTLSTIEVISMDVLVCSLGKTTNVALKATSTTSFRYGYLINGNPENLDVVLEKTMADGSIERVAPMEIIYDQNSVGAQILKGRYLDRWLELEVNYYDYALALLPVQNVEILWGEEVVFDVYAEFACEGEKLLAKEKYLTSTFTNKQVGTQQITITYLADPTLTTSFELKINDAFKEIALKEGPQTIYSLDQTFNPASTYVITMISGTTKEVNYNDEEFRYTPEFNSTQGAIGVEQKIYIYFFGEDVEKEILVWEGVCMVPDYVTKLEVVTSKSKIEYLYGESLEITVRAYYAKADMPSRELYQSEYTTNFNSKKVGVQEITVTYVYKDTSYTATFEVNVLDTILSISLATAPNRINYGYGDVIVWTGAKVNVKYAYAGVVSYVGEEIKENLDVTYTTIVSGQQKVTVGKNGQTTFFNINVSKESQAIEVVSISGIVTNLEKRQIALESPSTIGETIGAVRASDYLTLTYKSAKLGEIDLEKQLTKRTGTGDKLIFLNAEGVEVFVFNVYLKGDANGDGEITAEDLQGLAGMLANGTAKPENMDYNRDGKTNLTDLVGYARDTGGGTPKSVPVNDVARTFIATPSRLRNKENEHE